ncbi:MAG: hypothetical protein ABJA74_10775 [Lapillicoccus sp.]
MVLANLLRDDVGGLRAETERRAPPVLDEAVELNCDVCLFQEEVDDGDERPVLDAELRNCVVPHQCQRPAQPGLARRLGPRIGVPKQRPDRRHARAHHPTARTGELVGVDNAPV